MTKKHPARKGTIKFLKDDEEEVEDDESGSQEQ